MDITALLANTNIKQILAKPEVNAALTSLGDAAKADGEAFETKLSEALSGLTENSSKNTELTEMQSLLESLDESIFGTVMDSLNTKEVAMELTENPEAAKDVISELTGGHMQAIVMTDQSDEANTKDSLKEGVTGLIGSDDITTETLADNLETIIASLGQVTSGL